MYSYKCQSARHLTFNPFAWAAHDQSATGAACDGKAADEAWNWASGRMLASSERNPGRGGLEAPTLFKPKLTSAVQRRT